jgi:hypothetical protein
MHAKAKSEGCGVMKVHKELLLENFCQVKARNFVANCITISYLTRLVSFLVTQREG